MCIALPQTRLSTQGWIQQHKGLLTGPFSPDNHMPSTSKDIGLGRSPLGRDVMTWDLGQQQSNRKGRCLSGPFSSKPHSAVIPNPNLRCHTYPSTFVASSQGHKQELWSVEMTQWKTPTPPRLSSDLHLHEYYAALTLQTHTHTKYKKLRHSFPCKQNP